MKLFAREEEQFREKGKLEVLEQLLRLLFSHVSELQGTVFSVLKEILNTKLLYVRNFLPFVMSSVLTRTCVCWRARKQRAASFILETRVFAYSF